MTQSGWRVPAVVLLCGAVILSLNMGVRQTFGLFAQDMTGDLGVGLASFGLAMAVQNLLWGLCTPVCGMVADRYGTARVVVVGGLLYVLGILVMAFGGSEAALHLGGGILVGFAVSACGFPLVLAAVARAVSPEKRSSALGVASSGGSFGQFVLLPLAGQLNGWLGWSLTLAVLAALSFLIVPMAAAIAGKPSDSAMEEGSATSLSAAIKEAMGHRGFLLLTAGFFVCGFHVAFIATHLPSYIVSCNLAADVGANALGLIGFFNIAGTFLAGYLGGLYRKKYLLSGIYFARAVVIGLFLLGPKTELAVWLFSTAFGLLWLSTVPLTSGLVSQIFGPRYMATLFGIVMLSHQVGAFFGAWFGGLSFDATGSYDAVWAIAVLLGIVAAALHWPITDAPATGAVPERA